MKMDEEISFKEENGTIIFGGDSFRKPIRTFWVLATELSVAEGLSAINNHDAVLQETLRGKCYLDDGGIGVIGKKAQQRELSLNINGVEERHSLNEESEPAEKLSVFDGLPNTRACVGFNGSDWELGTRDDWFVDIGIPRQALNKLVEHVRAGRVNVLSIGLDLNEIYTNSYHAPPSCLVSWYLKPDKYGSPATYGRVRSLLFSEKSRSLELPEFRKSRLYNEEDAEQPQETEEAKLDVAETALKLAEAQITQTGHMVRSLKRLTIAVIIMTVVLAVGLLF
jgi:hypothetical protein